MLKKIPAEWNNAIHDGLDRLIDTEGPASTQNYVAELVQEFQGDPDDALENALEYGTAVLQMPKKLPPAATDHKRSGAGHPEVEAAGERRPDLFERPAQVAAARRVSGRNPRGLLNRLAVLSNGRIRQIDATAGC